MEPEVIGVDEGVAVDMGAQPVMLGGEEGVIVQYDSVYSSGTESFQMDPGFGSSLLVTFIFGLLGLAAIIASIVLWIYILVDVIRRTDIKENKLLWVLLLLFISPVGMIVYGFVENRKKLAWWSIASLLSLPVLLVLYMIFVAIVGSM